MIYSRIPAFQSSNLPLSDNATRSFVSPLSLSAFLFCCSWEKKINGVPES